MVRRRFGAAAVLLDEMYCLLIDLHLQVSGIVVTSLMVPRVLYLHCKADFDGRRKIGRILRVQDSTRVWMGGGMLLNRHLQGKVL